MPKSTTSGIYANKRQLLTLARAVLEYANNGGDRPIMPDTFGIARRSKHFDGIASAFPREQSAWARSWAKFEKFLDTGIPAWTIFADGNGKLPFKAFSALPLITCPGAGPCLEWCYSFKAWRFPDAYFRQLQNTVLLATTQGRAHIMREFRDIPHGVDLRLYVDGDMDSASTMGFWWGLLNSRPDIPTYGYSKSWQLFLDWHDAGREFPTNYLLNASRRCRYTVEHSTRCRYRTKCPTDAPMPKLSTYGRKNFETRRALWAWAKFGHVLGNAAIAPRPVTLAVLANSKIYQSLLVCTNHSKKESEKRIWTSLQETPKTYSTLSWPMWSLESVCVNSTT